MLALDVTRLEAGLILLEVDYTSARHAMNPEQNYCPFEIGLGRLVSFDKARLRRPARAPGASRRAGGPARRLVGLILDWYDIERLYDEQGLPPAISPTIDRSPVPVFAEAGRQVGKATSARLEPDPQAGDRARLGAGRATSASGRGCRSSGRSRAGAAGSTRRSSSCRSSTSTRKRA